MSRHIFLSPHFDDAVWSCGGYIQMLVRGGQSVQVLTVFGTQEVETTCQFGWRRVANPKIRVHENEKAMRYLSVSHESLDFTDAAFRVNEDSKAIYTESKQLFDEINLFDQEIQEAVFLELARKLLSKDIVYAPLALGFHVDHQIVKRACLKLELSKLFFYEDFPYEGEIDDNVWQNQSIPVVLEGWFEAASLYRSQVLYLFGSQSIFKQRLRQHAQSSKSGGYEQRLWTKTIL